MALSGKREYKGILLGTVKPHKDRDILDTTTDVGKAKLAARKENDNAYHDLVLANQTKVAFNIVDKSVSADLPDGDAFSAWESLKAKYNSTTTVTAVTLSEQYNSSKLRNTSVDPESWIVYLEVLQTRLNELKYTVTDNHLMIHVLHNIPKEYDTLVEAMERDLNDASDPLTIEGMKERLHSKWERLNRRNGNDDDDKSDDKMDLFMLDDDDIRGEAHFSRKQFKGRCRICGKIGHKGRDCFQNPKNQSLDRAYVGTQDKPFGSYNSGFRGRCNFCKQPGHIARYCRERQSTKDRNAFIAKKKRKLQDDEISLFAMHVTDPIDD